MFPLGIDAQKKMLTAEGFMRSIDTSQEYAHYKGLSAIDKEVVLLNDSFYVQKINFLSSHCCRPLFSLVVSKKGWVLGVDSVSEFNTVINSLFIDMNMSLFEKSILYLLLRKYPTAEVVIPCYKDSIVHTSKWVTRVLSERGYNLPRKFKHVIVKRNKVIIPTVLFSKQDNLCIANFYFHANGCLKKVTYRVYCKYFPFEMESADEVQSKNKCHPRTKIVKVER